MENRERVERKMVSCRSWSMSSANVQHGLEDGWVLPNVDLEGVGRPATRCLYQMWGNTILGESSGTTRAYRLASKPSVRDHPAQLADKPRMRRHRAILSCPQEGVERELSIMES